MLPILEESGLKVGEDFFLAYSPERVDPGREDWTTKNVPKVVGGVTPECTHRAAELYGGAVEQVVEVSSPEWAGLLRHAGVFGGEAKAKDRTMRLREAAEAAGVIAGPLPVYGPDGKLVTHTGSDN